jgi:hypothetical protein
MAQPLAFVFNPFKGSAHSCGFQGDSIDAASPRFSAEASACGIAAHVQAKMAFTQLMNCETSARYAAAECRPETPSLEEPPTPSGEEDTSAMLGDFAMGGECAQAMGPSTSYQPVEVSAAAS